MSPSTRAAWIATSRFGLGPQPGELDRAASDPRGWLVEQLDHPPRLPGPSHMALHGEVQSARQGGDKKAGTQAARRILRSEAASRLSFAIDTPHPFADRLARFWSNHFTVSVTQRRILHLAGAFEREVVRPRIAGSFSDLLLESTRHPAMLLYLDNAASLGPDSRLGRRTGRGLNENLAREILELHTLGVDGGYSQEDVQALAAMLTGWTTFGGPSRRAQDLSGAHSFTFRAGMHQPGSARLLGKRVPAGAQDQAEEALQRLARHPSTARFVSTKLARHFVSDTPPPRLVEHLARVFLDSEGDLREITTALVQHDDAWDPAHRKLRTPSQFVLATARAIDLSAYRSRRKQAPERLARVEGWLGQPAFQAPSPAGWPDTATAWASPELLLRRVELGAKLGPLVGPLVRDPVAWAQDALGPSLSGDLRRALARAPSRADAIALALASPAFQWS